jgi:hypothetical protein
MPQGIAPDYDFFDELVTNWGDFSVCVEASSLLSLPGMDVDSGKPFFLTNFVFCTIMGWP